MRACKSMTKITVIITLLVAMMMSCCVRALRDQKVEGFYLAAALPFIGVIVIVSVASAMVLVFQATMVIWVTLLVLLAFAGNHRRVLVQRGGRIIIDVAWYLISFRFKSQKAHFHE